MQILSRLKSIPAILLPFLFFACTEHEPDESGLNQFREFTIDAPSDHYKIKLTNTGKEAASFVLYGDGVMIAGEEQFKRFIVDMPGDYEGEHEVRKAWRFVVEKTRFDQPLTDKNWQHAPNQFLTSIGFGYCDDKASALAYLWETMGYFSRVWSLDGHVVPEVYLNDRWMMYDPEYEVYYLLEDSTVAGVEELQNAPNLINSGYQLPLQYRNISSLWNRYSQKTAQIYASQENNQVNEWYSDLLPIDPIEINLPPEAVLEFPGRFVSHLVTERGDTIEHFANARLQLPSGFSGEVYTGLVIHAITGKGSIAIDSIVYEIGSDTLDQLLAKRSSFISLLNVVESAGTIEVIYLLNPASVHLKDQGKIQLYGSGLEAVEMSTSELEAEHRVAWKDDPVMDFRSGDVETYMKLLKRYKKIKLEKQSDFSVKLMLVLGSDTSLSTQKSTEKYNLIKSCADSLFNRVENLINVNELLLRLNEDICFAVFVSLIETVSIDRIANILIHERGHFREANEGESAVEPSG